jgi:hypothetical protein
VQTTPVLVSVCAGGSWASVIPARPETSVNRPTPSPRASVGCACGYARRRLLRTSEEVASLCVLVHHVTGVGVGNAFRRALGVVVVVAPRCDRVSAGR